MPSRVVAPVAQGCPLAEGGHGRWAAGAGRPYNPPMKLAILGHHVAPVCPPFAGGVESLTWYLCRWLAQQGHEVVLFAPPGSAVPGVAVRDLDLDPCFSAAARADVSMPADAFMAAHNAYQRVLIDLAADDEGFDLVHCHSLHYLPVAMAPTLATPMLLTLHTPPTPWFEAALRARTTSSPRLSAVSPQTAQAWAQVEQVHDIVPNGVDLEAWPAGPGGQRAVWCGRMVPEKAPHLAMDAARLAGLPLQLAGPILDPRYWEAEVAPRLRDEINYVGHLGHADLARMLGAGCVALMTPEWEEPFGLVAAEAMCTGTPVAAFGRGALPSLIPEVAGRIARPGDVADLARAAREAAALSREQVRAYARTRFSLPTMGEAYERLYDRIVNRDTRSLQRA